MLNLIFYCCCSLKLLMISSVVHDPSRSSERRSNNIERGDALEWVRDSWKISRIVPHTTHNIFNPPHETELPPRRTKIFDWNAKVELEEGIEFNASGDLSRNLYTLKKNVECVETNWGWRSDDDMQHMFCVFNAHPSRRLRESVWSEHLFTSYQVNALGRN